jgi:hypothetical protein
LKLITLADEYLSRRFLQVFPVYNFSQYAPVFFEGVHHIAHIIIALSLMLIVKVVPTPIVTKLFVIAALHLPATG